MMNGCGGMWGGPGTMTWGWGGVLMWLFFLVLIVVLVLVISRGMLGGRGGSGASGGESALDIARKRFARGEISREEFEEIKRALTE